MKHNLRDLVLLIHEGLAGSGSATLQMKDRPEMVLGKELGMIGAGVGLKKRIRVNGLGIHQSIHPYRQIAKES